MHNSGMSDHMILYTSTQLRLGKEQWSVYRRYDQFQNLHKQMKMKYPEVRYGNWHVRLCHLIHVLFSWRDWHSHCQLPQNGLSGHGRKGVPVRMKNSWERDKKTLRYMIHFVSQKNNFHTKRWTNICTYIHSNTVCPKLHNNHIHTAHVHT